jgi:hypothetical protein
MIINSQIPTRIELNGPILSFDDGPAFQPVSVSQCSGTTASFTGLATATFPVQSPPNPAENSGYITYKWYEVGVGPLTDGERISGSNTTTLTITNLQTPSDHSRQFYLKADYIHSAYALPQGSTVTVGSAKSTGNALNDGLDSNIITLTVYPNLQVVTNPRGQTVTQTKIATFTAEGSLTDSRQGDLSYNWQLNEQDLNDGTITSTDQQVDQTYTSDATIVLPSDASNIIITVAGAGGGTGGNDPPPGNDPTAPPALGGSGGSGGVGVFRLPNGGRTLIFRVGKKGGDGVTGTRSGYGYPGLGGDSVVGSGGDGGGSGGVDPPVPAGQGGAAWSGGGAGGGGASGVHDSVANHFVVVAAGGGGGGGGSWNMPGGVGQSPERFSSTTGQFAFSDGQVGEYPGNVDGGGGGGAGGGAEGGVGGTGGRDNNFSSTGGSAGQSKFSSNRAEIFDESTNSGDGYINLKFTTRSSFPGVSGDRVTNTIIRGSKTKTLTIQSDSLGEYFVRSKLTHPTACNSPLFTESARYSIVSARQIINVEFINQNAGVVSGLASYNLFNTSSVTFDGSNVTGLICLYAAERDVNVILECYASKGQDANGYSGGQGGVSIIQFTMRANEEYIINNIPQANNSGAIFIYRQERLIVTVSAGGNAGSGGSGGAGGGINVAGASGEGRGAGSGGILYQAGTLAFPGIFGSAALGIANLIADDSYASIPFGGRIIPCPRGGYWLGRGYAPCQRIGQVPFYNAGGTLVPGTATIDRGFKAGYGIRNTAGRGINGGGTGGNGATGGNGGDGGGGGGGGSGYTDGSVTILSTQLGGNNGQPRVVMRLGELL